MTYRSRLRPTWPLPAMLFAAVMASAANGAELLGIVTEVQNGDSLTLVNWNATYNIRLAEIDAPEWDQKYGKEAHAALIKLCALKRASAETIGEDRRGRTFARVTCGGKNASAEQVRNGWAWVFRRHVGDSSPLYLLEEQARKSRLGIWQDGEPTPPWEWRRAKREAKREARRNVPPLVNQ